jgi:hypothetical protein
MIFFQAGMGAAAFAHPRHDPAAAHQDGPKLHLEAVTRIRVNTSRLLASQARLNVLSRFRNAQIRCRCILRRVYMQIHSKDRAAFFADPSYGIIAFL